MDYVLSEIEDQIIATLKANTDLASMSNNIQTHAGQISMQMLLDPQFYEGVLRNLPFIYVRYNGKVGTPISSDQRNWKHELHWMFYVGAESLRMKQESQRSCYSMLASIFDTISGAWPYSTQQLSTSLKFLSGTQITTDQFGAITPFLEMGGEDEKLVTEDPKVAIYSTTYKVTVQTRS